MGIMIIALADPPVGERWCYVDAARAKAALIKAHGIDEAWMKENVYDTPEDDIKVVAPPKRWVCPPLRIAVVDTGECWSHLPAYDPDAVQEMAPAARGAQILPPGLMRGLS